MAVIAALLLTVLLAKVLFSSAEMALLMQDKLNHASVFITKEMARSLAKIYTHCIWDWHTVLGYVLSGLLVYRFSIEKRQAKSLRLFQTIKTIRNDSSISSQVLYVKCLYLVFYFLLICMVCTGLFIAWSDDVAALKASRKLVKTIHEYGMYAVLTFILIHVLGVVRQWLKDSKD
jgi:cytochrome b561